jgi:hypothetical protein
MHTWSSDWKRVIIIILLPYPGWLPSVVQFGVGFCGVLTLCFSYCWIDLPCLVFRVTALTILHPVWGVRGGTDNANLVRSGRETVSGNLPWFAALV